MKLTADHVARAVVWASKEFKDVHPEKIVRAPTERSLRDDWAPISLKRARAYAALALFEVFPDHPRVSIARMVGSLSPKTYIWSCEHLKRTGKYDSWWSDEAFARIVAAVNKDSEDSKDAEVAKQRLKEINRDGLVQGPELQTRLAEIEVIVPRPVPTVLPSTPSHAKPITPNAVLRQPPAPTLAPDKPAGPLRQRMDRLADGVSRAPRSPSNPNMDWLTERAIDRGRSRDLLAEAAANTRKLQEAMPPEPEGSGDNSP